jgi:hypothetical protein
MNQLDKTKVYNVLCRRKLSLNSPKSWASFLIRIFSKSEIDHVGFTYFKEEVKAWLQAEATTGKAKILTLEEWHNHATNAKMEVWIQEDRMATDRREQMIAYAEASNGKLKYDFFGLLWMAIYIKRKIWLGRKRNQDDRQFCSEFYFNAKGIEGAQYKTPKDVYLAGNEVIGKLIDVSLGKPFIVEHLRIPS